jgi:gamma-glutamylputrescine oxidase
MFRSATADALLPSARHVDSYYAATAQPSVAAPPLEAATRCEVCVVGGGYTGLSCALHLARRGVDVVLLEQSRLGWGASGRNGGQVHVGLRRDPEWVAARLGADTGRALWRLALDARDHLAWLLSEYQIECDFRSGLLHANHRERYSAETKRYVELLRSEYRYRDIRFVPREQMAEYVASEAYHSGYFDAGGGHLHALNFALGLARAAAGHGARLHESSEATAVERAPGGYRVRAAAGAVSARRVLIACNGYLRGLCADIERHVMPINNFIAVTEPLGAERARALIPAGCAVSDSRFVVHYYRITADHRLLFGGGENYSYRFPADIAGLVRGHVRAVFPELSAVRFDYAWGGTLAITPTRMPYVREIAPDLYCAAGYSGLGVVMAPYGGRAVANAMMGERAALELLSRLPVPPFPGGKALRWPTLVAALSFYAARDRL